MNKGSEKRFVTDERYHLFHRGEWVCRYGVFGLTREYFPKNHTIPPVSDNQKITLNIPEAKIQVMQAVITSHCNLTCKYCSFIANAPRLSIPEMNREEIENLCCQFNENIGTGGVLLITGGEPELHPGAVDYLIDNIVGKIIIFTNGTKTVRERLRHYKQRNVGILFSLDGDLFAQDTVRRGKDGSYKQVAKALKTAHELDLNYGISAVVGDHNIDRLPELVEYIHKEFHPASLGLNLPHRYGSNTWMRIEEYTDALLKIFSYAKREGLFIDQINRRLSPLISQEFRFRDCSAQGEKIVVYPGGQTTSCVNEAALKTHSVDWENRIPILNEQCRSCYVIGICGGGCIFDGEAIYGEGCFDERNCYFTKALLEYMVWDLWDELGDDSYNTSLLNSRYKKLLAREEGTLFSVGHEIV